MKGTRLRAGALLPAAEGLLRVRRRAAAKIFVGMAKVAKMMATDDPSCAHVAFTRTASYAPVATWIRSRVDSFLSTLSNGAAS